MNTSPLLTEDQAADFLTLPVEELQTFRDQLTGPNFLLLNGQIRYLQSDLITYLESLRQLPTDAQKMQAALKEGSAGVRAALKERTDAMKKLDADDRVLNEQKLDESTGVTMSLVGSQPGIQRHFNCPPQPFSNAPAPHIIQGR